MRLALPRIEDRNRSFLLLLGGAIVLAVVLAYSIVYPNPYLLLGVLFVFLALVIAKSNVVGLYLIALSVFFSDWFVQLGLIPAPVTLGPEVIVLLYFIKSFLVTPKRTNPKFLLLFTPFAVSAVISLVATFGEEHIVTILFGFRSLFRFVILFYAVQVLPYTERQIKRFVAFLLTLLLIQIPVAVVKLFIHGQGESAIGTYGEAIGTYSTILPLIGICIFFGIHYFFRRSIWNIVACAGFMAFGVIGMKRALIVFFPLIMLYLMFSIPRAAHSWQRRAVTYAMLAVFLGLGVWAPLTFMRTLREDPIGYAIAYETAMSGDQSMGRASTSVMIFHHMTSSPMRFLFGFSPGSFQKSLWPQYQGRIRRDKGTWGIMYGTSGFSWSSLEFGYLGALLYLLPIAYLFFVARRGCRSDPDPYWRALSFSLAGIVFTSVVIYMVYSIFFRLDIAAFLLFTLGGFVYRREAASRIEGAPPAFLPEGEGDGR